MSLRSGVLALLLPLLALDGPAHHPPPSPGADPGDRRPGAGLSLPARGDPAPERDELRERRERALARLGGGILLLHARPGPKAEDQPRFNQNASFF